MSKEVIFPWRDSLSFLLSSLGQDHSDLPPVYLFPPSNSKEITNVAVQKRSTIEALTVGRIQNWPRKDSFHSSPAFESETQTWGRRE